MIGNEKRLRKKSFLRWDFIIDADDPRAFGLTSMMLKGMNPPMEVLANQSRNKDKCPECFYKRAILQILRTHGISVLSELGDEKKPRQPEE